VRAGTDNDKPVAMPVFGAIGIIRWCVPRQRFVAGEPIGQF